VDDPENTNLSRLYTVEDQIVVYGKVPHVGTQIRFEAFAYIGEPGKQPELVCN
jgi:hypothetical protein